MELAAIEVPDNALVNPVAGAKVDLETPSVPVLVGEVYSGSDTIALVADTTREGIAVHGAMADQLAVDGLKNVELTTLGPAAVVSNGIAEHPPSGPDTLLAARVIAAKAKKGFDTGELASLRSEGVLGFNTARGPAAAVSPGNNLEGVATAQLDVAGIALVDFKLIVDTEVASYDVPVTLVGKAAAVATEVVLPDTVETTILGSVPGTGESTEGQDRRDETSLDHVHCMEIRRYDSSRWGISKI